MPCEITNGRTATARDIVCRRDSDMAAIRLTGTPDGKYWIRVLDDNWRAPVRQLRGPFHGGQILGNLLSVGLNEDEVNSLIFRAHEDHTASLYGITPRLAQ
jgi:hypothetical protein